MSADLIRLIDQTDPQNIGVSELHCVTQSIAEHMAIRGIDEGGVRAFELMKDRLFGLTGKALIDIANALHVAPTNKAVINAFIDKVFPDFVTRTLAEQAINLRGIEAAVLDHFRGYDITAITAGSFGILGNPSTPQSDYDVIVVAEHDKENNLIAAMQNLSMAGVQGFDTAENGGLQGANLVVDHGNQGFGFVRGLSTKVGTGTVVEIFVFGQRSLVDISTIGGRVKKLQPPRKMWTSVKDLANLGSPQTIMQPSPENWEYSSWPQVDDRHGVGFHENLFLTAHGGEHDPRRLLAETKEGVLTIAAELMKEYGHSNGNRAELLIAALGYGGHPNFDPTRRRQVLDHFSQVE